MTEEIEKTADSSNLKKGTSLTSAGLIGAWLTSLIQSNQFDKVLSENLLLGVPFFSVCFTEVVIWFWCFFGPANAKMISYRRGLKKTKRQIEKELNNPMLSQEHKGKLQKKYEQISDDLINSYHSTDLK